MVDINARKFQALVKYDGKDISSYLEPYLKSINYTDNMSGEADDLQITLMDKDGLWQSSWLPEKGATLDVTFVLYKWDGSVSTVSSHVGLFEIDEITCQGNPSEVQIKAVSIPDDNNLRGSEHTRSWEKAELKRIANDVAVGAGLELAYLNISPYNGREYKGVKKDQHRNRYQIIYDQWLSWFLYLFHKSPPFCIPLLLFC